MTEERESVLAASELDRLITALVQREYEVIGPVMRDEAIVYDRVESIEDLPAGWTDEQEPGRYRLKRREDGAAAAQVRHMDTTDIRELLYSNFEHPRWDNVAERCLACTN